MNHFHRDNLRSGIRESHQVPVQADWAYAIRKQARLMLLPLFREVIVDWKDEKTGKRPFLKELAAELFRGFYRYGGVPVSMQERVSEKVLFFINQLSEAEKSILKFYFLSEDKNIEALANENIEKIQDDPIPLDKLDRLVGKTLKIQFSQFSESELERCVTDELHEIENIISDSDLDSGLDTEAITRINESFSNYLDLPYGEISLIQKPIEEWDYWEKAAAEEPETIGKRIRTDSGLEWVECWLLLNGQIRVKGDFLDEPDRNDAAIQVLRTELLEILKAVHEQLTQHYDLMDSHIHYTFFTRRETLENVVPEEGIQFFVDQIESHGADDFEPRINLDIRRYQNKTLQEWGTQISLGIEERYWLTEDEQHELRVWVLTMEGEETPLETRFSEEQKEAIILTILGHIHHTYHLDHESK
jgi:hypothetical protein